MKRQRFCKKHVSNTIKI